MSEFHRRRNILIISEGFEEKPYMDKILSFPNINKDAYFFLPVVNAKGNGNIIARYQYEIQRGFYDIVLIFCDADKGSAEFHFIIEELGKRFFKNSSDAKEVFIFANPVTLQLVLSHFGEVKLTKVSKASNEKIVEKLTGVSNYKASAEQIDCIINKIHYNSLDKFKERISKLPEDFECVPSSNFAVFLRRFESDETTWIDDINSLRKNN